MRALLFITYLFFSFPLFGQISGCHLIVKGQVLDSSTMSPIMLANIAVVGNKDFNVSTDNKGQFILNNVCPGPIELHVSHLQCEHIHLDLYIRRDTSITIYLMHTEHELEGYKAVKANENEEDIDHLNAKKLEIRKGSSISELMKDIGGISLLKTGSTISKPIVNGLHSNRVIILNNGIRQEGQNWGMEHAPEIDAFLATDIALMKGAESLRYASDGIGGVIMVRPESIFNEKSGKVRGAFNIVGMTNGRGGVSSLILGTKLSEKIPLYFRVQGTIKKSGNYRAPDYFISNTGYEELNYSAAMGYKVEKFRIELFYSAFNNKTGIYKGSQIGNINDLMNAINSDTPTVISGFTYQIDRPYQMASHRLYKASAEFLLNSQNRIQLNLAYQKDNRKEYDVLRSSNSPKGPDFNYFLNTVIGDVAYLKTDFHKINFTGGLYGIYQENSYSGRYLLPGFYNKGAAAYCMVDKAIGKLKIEAALRYDYKRLTSYLWNANVLNVSRLDFHNGTYLLQAVYRKNRSLQYTIGTSSAWRPPAPNELYSNGLHQGLATIEVGDSTMKPERSYNFVFNTKYNTATWFFESELYYKWIKGFINLIPSMPPQMTIRGAFPVYRYVQQDADLYGLNFLVRKEFTKGYFVKGNGNILIADNRDEGEPLSQMPPLNGNLSVGKETKRYMVQAWCNLTAKQFRYVDGTDYAAPPDGFILTGLDASYEFRIKKQPFKFNVSVNNLLNTRYREYLDRFRYFVDAQGFGLTARLIVPLDVQYNSNQSPLTE